MTRAVLLLSAVILWPPPACSWPGRYAGPRLTCTTLMTAGRLGVTNDQPSLIPAAGTGRSPYRAV